MIQLGKTKAADIMQTDLVQLHALTPIRSAVENFEEYRISGAPVVNEAGELVGVLAASDIVKSEHLQSGSIEDQRGAYYFNDPLLDDEWGDGPWGDDGPFSREDYSPEILGRETVGDWMNPNLISVRPEASLHEVCALMARERIHRVFVVKNKLLLGVVSTFDVVKYLADNG